MWVPCSGARTTLFSPTGKQDGNTIEDAVAMTISRFWTPKFGNGHHNCTLHYKTVVLDMMIIAMFSGCTFLWAIMVGPPLWWCLALLCTGLMDNRGQMKVSPP